MQVSKVLIELRKTRQLVVEAIVRVQKLTDEREVQRWVTAATKKKAGPKRVTREIPARKRPAGKGE